MRIAVLADIHGNLPALEAVLADIARRGADRILDLGDRVSGPLWPRETFERLAGVAGVRGNHDRWVGEAVSAAALGGSDRVAHEALTSDQRAALLALPVILDCAPGVAAFHATPADDNRYLLDDIVDGRLVRAGAAAIAARLGAVTAPVVLVAHSHRADMVRLSSGALVVNPGSVGCPAYADPTGIPHVSEAGSPHARYATIDLSNGDAEVTFLALRYDWESAARRAEAFGRADWTHALRTGFMAPG